MKIVPDRRGDRATGDAIHRDVSLQVPHPHAGGQLRDVAAEPLVRVRLRGPRLAGHRPLAQGGGGSPPMADDALQGPHDGRGDVLRREPVRRRGRPAARRPHLRCPQTTRTGGRRAVDATGRERRVSRGHLERASPRPFRARSSTRAGASIGSPSARRSGRRARARPLRPVARRSC
jgi:hypothetical protein